MSIFKAILGVLAVLAVVSGEDRADAGGWAEYTIVDLGTLGGPTSVAIGINDLGQVVGSADTPQWLRHAFIWEDGVMTDLGTLSQHSQSEANDVNNLGQAVGISTNTGWGTTAVLWADGEIVNLGILSGTGSQESKAKAIDDAGRVVGEALVPFVGRHAFLWEDGAGTDLTETYGFAGRSARDINRFTDVVVGPSLLHRDGTVTELPTLGGDLTQGYALNDLTQVVGWSERTAGERDVHAFLWQDGEIIDLGSIAGFEPISKAEAINNMGQVVGWGVRDLQEQPFIYAPDTGMRNLQDLIPANSGWTNLLPWDINDAGQIVGGGAVRGQARAFLMTTIASLACSGDEKDCQPNASPDACDIEFGLSGDCNGNSIPDECEADCNGNEVADECDIRDGTSFDYDGNGVPDECQPDCNENDLPDSLDIALGYSLDCNDNLVPDECDILEGASADCDANGVPDECQADCNANSIADACEADTDGDGFIDACEDCPNDPDKISPGSCGCGLPDVDGDGDGVLDCIDTCGGVDDTVFGPCEPSEIPATSTWGLIVLTLLMLTGGKLGFGRRVSPGSVSGSG